MLSPELTQKAALGERLSREEAFRLMDEATLCELGGLAHPLRLRKADPDSVTYVVDRNINYTNICVSGCKFCAFFRPPGHSEGFLISEQDLDHKIEEAQGLGASQILIQGGLHPDLGLEYYTKLLEHIREKHGIHVHGFSPPEIVHLSGMEKLSCKEVLQALKEAGLHSMPGGGAEILTEGARLRVSPGKCTAAQWLDVMREAHGLGMRTTATMMFGHGEAATERVEHLLALRELQDETGGFTAFIPWTFQPGNTALADLSSLGGYEYLKMLALSRIVLDNFRNLQVSWVTQGPKVAQAGLYFGANDFGSTMIEENVVAAAGVSHLMSIEEIRHHIRSAGFAPVERNQAYEPIPSAGPDSRD
jgi:cyclic dehypoxanthinyl futalosine synthase